MSNLKSQFATSSSVASYILKLEIPNRNTKFYVRLLFAFTVYHTFFCEDSHNLTIFAEKEDKTICLSKLPYPLFPYKFFANVFSNCFSLCFFLRFLLRSGAALLILVLIFTHNGIPERCFLLFALLFVKIYPQGAFLFMCSSLHITVHPQNVALTDDGHFFYTAVILLH